MTDNSPVKKNCKKCLGTEIEVTYKPKKEILHHKCLTCDYGWNEPTADKEAMDAQAWLNSNVSPEPRSNEEARRVQELERNRKHWKF